MQRLIGWTGFLLLLIAAQSFAGQFEDGVSAASKGDYATAVKLWRPLAKQGNVKAQFNLGLMYHRGMGVPKDDRETAKWWRKAAKRGYATAQTNLANMYQFGLGVPKNYKEAAKWYRHAAKQGDVKAQYSLGFMYLKGIGVPLDNQKAMTWFRRAADRGDANAQFYLGFMYEQGQGEKTNRVAAFALYSLNTTQHHTERTLASLYRDRLIDTLSATEIKQGQALTQKLLQSKPMTKALDAYLGKSK